MSVLISNRANQRVKSCFFSALNSSSPVLPFCKFRLSSVYLPKRVIHAVQQGS